MVDSDKVRALLDRGLTHYGLGEVSRALEIWNKVLELDPSNVRAKEYVRFVNDNWAPKADSGKTPYRPDEGTDPSRLQENDAASPAPSVPGVPKQVIGKSPDSSGETGQNQRFDSEQDLFASPAEQPAPSDELAQGQLKPGEIPLPDESGFVPPVRPLANLWGDLYDFSGLDSSTGPSIPMSPPEPLFEEQGEPKQQESTATATVVEPLGAPTSATVYAGSEDPTLESESLSRHGYPGSSDTIEESTAPSQASVHDVPDALLKAELEESFELSGHSVEAPKKRDVEVFMSSTLPPRPAELEPGHVNDSDAGNSEPGPSASPPIEPAIPSKFPASESLPVSDESLHQGGGLSDGHGQPGVEAGQSGVVINPTPPFVESDYEEPSALSLVSTDLQESATEVEPPPPEENFHDSMMKGARDLLEVDDFTGALDVLKKILERFPDDQEAKQMEQEARQSLLSILTAKLGDMEQSPEVCMSNDEIIWLNLDNRAGFVLSLVDGSTSYEDILSLCGLDRLDGIRILSQLVQDKVICVT